MGPNGSKFFMSIINSLYWLCKQLFNKPEQYKLKLNILPKIYLIFASQLQDFCISEQCVRVSW